VGVVKDCESPLSVMLDRLILLVMLLALAGILTSAMAIQFVDRENPCPLCLLQRVAMFGCCFGLIHQLRSGGSQRSLTQPSSVLLKSDVGSPSE
jgi:disulfide bond formation protein DsbB